MALILTKCFHCKADSNNLKNGWRLINGSFAKLCELCSIQYENDTFCAKFHSSSSGWRNCRICGLFVHCGCRVSLHLYEPLDTDDIGCLRCTRKALPLIPIRDNPSVITSSGRLVKPWNPSEAIYFADTEGDRSEKRPIFKNHPILPNKSITIPLPKDQPKKTVQKGTSSSDKSRAITEAPTDLSREANRIGSVRQYFYNPSGSPSSVTPKAQDQSQTKGKEILTAIVSPLGEANKRAPSAFVPYVRKNPNDHNPTSGKSGEVSSGSGSKRHLSNEPSHLGEPSNTKPSLSAPPLEKHSTNLTGRLSPRDNSDGTSKIEKNTLSNTGRENPHVRLQKTRSVNSLVGIPSPNLTLLPMWSKRKRSESESSAKKKSGGPTPFLSPLERHESPSATSHFSAISSGQSSHASVVNNATQTFSAGRLGNPSKPKESTTPFSNFFIHSSSKPTESPMPFSLILPSGQASLASIASSSTQPSQPKRFFANPSNHVEAITPFSLTNSSGQVSRSSIASFSTHPSPVERLGNPSKLKEATTSLSTSISSRKTSQISVPKSLGQLYLEKQLRNPSKPKEATTSLSLVASSEKKSQTIVANSSTQFGNPSKLREVFQALVPNSSSLPSPSPTQNEIMNPIPYLISPTSTHQNPEPVIAKEKLNKFGDPMAEYAKRKNISLSNEEVEPGKPFLRCLFKKRLNVSDSLTHFTRFILPNACAEGYLPVIPETTWVKITFQDTSDANWDFRYLCWKNGTTRMYGLDGLSGYRNKMEWKVGDLVTFYKIEPNGNFVIGTEKGEPEIIVVDA